MGVLVQCGRQAVGGLLPVASHDVVGRIILASKGEAGMTVRQAMAPADGVGGASAPASAEGKRQTLEQLRAVLADANSSAPPGREARQHVLRALEARFASHFPVGSSVVIELDTFGFVTGATRARALRAFIDTFGKDAPGWAFDVGRPLSVGVGTCTS